MWSIASHLHCKAVTFQANTGLLTYGDSGAALQSLEAHKSPIFLNFSKVLPGYSHHVTLRSAVSSHSITSANQWHLFHFCVQLPSPLPALFYFFCSNAYGFFFQYDRLNLLKVRICFSFFTPLCCTVSWFSQFAALYVLTHSDIPFFFLKLNAVEVGFKKSDYHRTLVLLFYGLSVICYV